MRADPARQQLWARVGVFWSVDAGGTRWARLAWVED